MTIRLTAIMGSTWLKESAPIFEEKDSSWCSCPLNILFRDSRSSTLVLVSDTNKLEESYMSGVAVSYCYWRIRSKIQHSCCVGSPEIPSPHHLPVPTIKLF